MAIYQTLCTVSQKVWHDNAIVFWKTYPTFIKQLFIRAFTEGLKRNNRIMEIEWRDNMPFDGKVKFDNLTCVKNRDGMTHRSGE